MKRIETWWIVRLVSMEEPEEVRAHLCCDNSYSVRVHPSTRKGRKRPRQWALRYRWDGAFRFQELRDARSCAKSIVMVKEWLEKHDGFVEIVEQSGDPGEWRHESEFVVERPGCPPLLALALEAA